MSLLKHGYTGATLIILGGFLGIFSWFQPFFSTTTWGTCFSSRTRQWIIADYPVIVLDAKLYALWSLVVANSGIVLLFLALGGLLGAGNAISRLVGILCSFIAIISSAALYFADDFMMKLFFSPDLVTATHAAGFWELAVANVVSVLGSFIMAIYPIVDTTSAVHNKNDTKPKNAKASNGLRDFSLRSSALLVCLIAVVFINAKAYQAFSDPVKVSELVLPDGFHAHVFADGVPEARSMVVSPRGNVYVGTRMTGDVYVITDRDNNKRADHIWKIATGLVMPNGIAFKDNALYVAEPDKLWRFEDIDVKLEHMMEKYDDIPQYEKPKVRDVAKFMKPRLLHKDWPMYQHHGWRYMKFGPDGRLYIAFGAPCNVCKRNDTWFATIMRKANPLGDDWSEWEVYATGIRNSVGFDWHPETGELWFTDNGRDWAGHNFPADEFNRAHKAGLHFGFPECVEKNTPDPDVINKTGIVELCNQREPAAYSMQPHAAALGVHFYRGTMFPAEWRNRAIVAEHGSWNRVPFSGYRVSYFNINSTQQVDEYKEFIGGFLRDGKVAGRPVDVVELQDGSLLVSDDYSNKIYRIHYRDSKKAHKKYVAPDSDE